MIVGVMSEARGMQYEWESSMPRRRGSFRAALEERLRSGSFGSDRSRSPVGRNGTESFTLYSDSLQTPSKDQFQEQIRTLEQVCVLALWRFPP